MILWHLLRVREPYPETRIASGADRIPGLSGCAKAILTCRNVPSRHTIGVEMLNYATKPIRLKLVSYFKFFRTLVLR